MQLFEIYIKVIVALARVHNKNKEGLFLLCTLGIGVAKCSMKISQITMKVPFHFHHLSGEAVIIVVDRLPPKVVHTNVKYKVSKYCMLEVYASYNQAISSFKLIHCLVCLLVDNSKIFASVTSMLWYACYVCL